MTLLNRNELLDALEAERKECRLENERSGFERAYNIVECMGTEPDVELVRHGKWNEIVTHNGCTPDYDIVCSLCGSSGLPEYKYCPNCGAKMTTA